MRKYRILFNEPLNTDLGELHPVKEVRGCGRGRRSLPQTVPAPQPPPTHTHTHTHYTKVGKIPGISKRGLVYTGIPGTVYTSGIAVFGPWARAG